MTNVKVSSNMLNVHGGKALDNYFPSICNHMLQYRRSSSLPSKIHGISCTSPNPSFTEGAS